MVALDAHKRYSLGSIEDAEGGILAERMVPHRRGEIRGFLTGLEPGTPVALETIGSWYWIDHLAEEVACFEQRIAQVFEGSAEVELIDTLPGVGPVLAVVICLELGDVNRFPSAGKLTGYSGTVPRLHQSGSRLRHGPTRRDVNHYLK